MKNNNSANHQDPPPTKLERSAHKRHMWTQLCLHVSVSCTVWLGTWAMSSWHICNVRSAVNVTGVVLQAITLRVINWCSILAKLGTDQDWCRDWSSTSHAFYTTNGLLYLLSTPAQLASPIRLMHDCFLDVLSCFLNLLYEYCISLLKLPIRARGCPWKPFFTLAMQSVATVSHQICYQCLFTWNGTVNLSGDVLNYS